VVLADYGSMPTYKTDIKKLTSDFNFSHFISCETEQQLWCKSRAINIALKQCETPYVFVGDVDMVYHPEFINTLNTVKNEAQITYFQVGFLSETESKTNSHFEDYKIAFKSDEEATGMTLYPTEVLKSIHGYDEFYHGWGAEDTDVHIRLKNAGYPIHFYSKEILMLHQWHPKSYRNKNDLAPFHSILEKINHDYLRFSKSTNKIKANLNFPWGVYNPSDYEALKKIETSYNLTNKESEIKAFINNVLVSEKNKVVEVLIQPHRAFKSIKQRVKKILGRKTVSFLSMDTVNDLLLESIITNLRDKAHQFQYDSKKQTIHLIIKL
tara:strand:- start:129131 stop:130102 length:972 start_codon:yes stop_codon:yes gene_type:complete